jgi:hypothetical protein
MRLAWWSLSLATSTSSAAAAAAAPTAVRLCGTAASSNS